LFPIRENGLNSFAQALTKHESNYFKNSKECQNLFITSLKLMLNFFGIKLVSENEEFEDFEYMRDEDNYQERFLFLQRSSHNYLRITRILKCLGIKNI
jgi:hypothetical protein